MNSTLTNRCYVGDCRDSMRQMIANGVRVQTCVTSPPYFGLRDYQVEGQLGLEATPKEFVNNMVEVFSLARELLADDGTLWLNLGDSYCSIGHKKSSSGYGTSKLAGGPQLHTPLRRENNVPGLKHKDLIGIPWRVAFALQADGWYLRQDIIWQKPNPMPESVTDRCTKSHEYIFLLSKSERYYFDHEEIKEPAAPSSISRWAQDVENQAGSNRVPGKTNGSMKAVGGDRSKRDSFKRDSSKRAQAIPNQTVGTHRPDREEGVWDTSMRNKRSVWEVATQPYSGAHFATFPPALIEPCILAGSRVNDIVFDPFLGSGTTAQVAQSLGRRWIGCELNSNYIELQNERTRQNGLAFDQEVVA